MNNSKTYIGIDYFRFVAAFLVIAIHTSPLITYSETGDFILTRIVARVAVPFFWMTSGFFLISRYAYNADKLKAFIKNTTLTYGISIVIYIPLNIYTGYFKMDHLLPNMIKDIFFDGTMYHLWYLPASMAGAAIAWFIVRKTGFRKALVITTVLYIIGLFGDSYYGVAIKIPLLKNLYGYIFEVTDYTRNGIFFAPVFFVMGGMAADNASHSSFIKSLMGFGVSFLLMIGEGMLLHRFDLQRHDSMYWFLLPCMYYLFHMITLWKGQRKVLLRTMALVIYIIHPMVIVVVRLFAKISGLQGLLIENSLIHFLAVSMASTVFSVIFARLLYKVKNNREAPCSLDKDRAWIEVDLNNLEHNVQTLKNAMPSNCELMAVVKAEAYGHGLYETATYLDRIGVKAFAVATIDEGIRLRRYGVSGEILILGYTAPARAKELRKYDLTQTLIDYEYSLLLNKQGYLVKAHIKIDTGMHRLGFNKDDIEKICDVYKMKHIKVCGIYTHLCAADSLKDDDIDFTNMQIAYFYKLLGKLEEKGMTIPKIHIQSSYGFLNYPELKCDYVRAGIALYGVLSNPDDKTKLHLDLRPVLSLKARVVLLRVIKKGESVGYGRAFVAARDSVIAMLSIGYADGFPRNLSYEKGYVLIHGHKVPVVGRICMDQLAVDVTDIPDVRTGVIATLIGKDGDEEIAAPIVADNSESIANELLSRMGRRLKVRL